MVTVLIPLPIAVKFKIAIEPGPDTPGEPGTRETVRVASPVSLRISFTEVDWPPSRENRSPGPISFRRSCAGSNLILIGDTETTSAAFSSGTLMVTTAPSDVWIGDGA